MKRLLLTLLLLAAPTRAAEVTLYASVDGPALAAAVKAFEAAGEHTVRLVTDTEATKSVGLANRIRAEKGRPRADVYWGNEPFRPIALAEEGLLRQLPAGAADGIDARYVDEVGRWAGVGLRARVLVAPAGDRAYTGLNDLLDPALKGRVAVSRPTAGSFGGHVAALYVAWGDERADDFFRKLRANGCVVLGSNSAVAKQAADGNILLGLTDNDDVANVGAAVRQVVPDQDGAGTLVFPTVVAMVDKPDASAGAEALARFLLSRECEAILLKEKFAQFSVRGEGNAVVALKVDYREVAKRTPEASRRAERLLEGE